VVGLLLIPLWQLSFYTSAGHLDKRYVLWAATGLHDEQKFVYFLYYQGLFPVATEHEDPGFSRGAAEAVIRDHGDTLLMEWNHTIRAGGLLGTFLHLPDVWLKGEPRAPSVRPCHAVAFIAALMALYLAFWRVRMTLFGALAVVLLGSNPFQLLEVYGRENVFGWPITSALLVLALCVPLLHGLRVSRYYLWALPVLAGAVLGTTRHIRVENVPILLSVLVVCALAPGERWRVRAALAVVCLVSFVGVSNGWRAWFGHKRRVALDVVTRAGGHPYTYDRLTYHTFWPPIWSGLGDYGGKYGYEWEDGVAVKYALPILEERYGLTPKWSRVAHFLDEYWDPARKYRRSIVSVAPYHEVLREKVLGDIGRDPLWYAGVLARRVGRVFMETTPVRVGLGRHWLPVPMHGLLLLPVLALLVWARAWPMARILCFTLPLSATAVAVYSGRGMCFYACYHIFVAAFLLTRAAEFAVTKWRASRGERIAVSS
jgi:hypothetical protein